MSEDKSEHNEILNFPFSTESGLQFRPVVVEKKQGEQFRDPLLDKLAEFAAISMACANKSTAKREEKLARSGSSLIKGLVGQFNEEIKNRPENILNYLPKMFEQYRRAVCVPLAASQLEPGEAGNFVRLYLSLLKPKSPDHQEKPDSKLQDFEKKVTQSIVYREKFQRFCNSIEGRFEEFTQGVMAEFVFYNLSRQAGLKPEFSPVSQDTKGHIDYFIYPDSKEAKVQVKSNKFFTEPEIRKLPDGRWLVILGAPPLDLSNPRVVEYYRRMLFPDKELKEKFSQSFKNQNNQPETYIPARFRVKVPV